MNNKLILNAKVISNKTFEEGSYMLIKKTKGIKPEMISNQNYV
jgi:hypothetical protein